MRHDDQVAAVADCVHDRVGVLRPAGRLVVARQVDGHQVVAAFTQFGGDQVPVPGAPSAAVDEDERRHLATVADVGAIRRKRSISRAFESGP